MGKIESHSIVGAFCSLIMVAACSQSPSGAGESLSAVTIQSEGSLDIAIGTFVHATGGKSCTIIGTTKVGRASGHFLGLSSAHCFPSVLNCDGTEIQWAGGGKSTCVNTLGGAGEGKGDYVLFEYRNIEEPKYRNIKIAKVFSEGEELRIENARGVYLKQCKVTALEKNSFVHDCLGEESPGFSGSPIFQMAGQELELVGFHVAHSPGKKFATIWSKDILNPESVEKNIRDLKRQSRETEICRQAFADFLMKVGVKQPSGARTKLPKFTIWEDFNEQADKAILPGTFSEFLSNRDYMPFYYEQTCKSLGGSDGRGLLKLGDGRCKPMPCPVKTKNAD